MISTATLARLVCYFAIALVTCLVIWSITTPIWFGRIRMVRNLRGKLPKLNAEVVNAPCGINLERWRMNESWGDKVVVVHHLPGVADEFEAAMGRNIIVGTLFNIILAALFIVMSFGHRVAVAAPTDFFDPFVVAIPSFLSLAGFAVSQTIIAVVHLKIVLDQFRKYRAVVSSNQSVILATPPSSGTALPPLASR